MKSLIAGVLGLILLSSCPIKPPNPNPSPTPTPVPTPSPTPLPTPTPVPTPTPTPNPIPTPTPPISCSIPDLNATFITPRPVSAWTDVINNALVQLTACEIQSRCVVNLNLDGFLSAVVQRLKQNGFCAGIQTGADEVCIGGVAKCQGYHVFVGGLDPNKGTVGWAPGSARDTWIAPIPTTPTPTPTPVSQCPPSLDKIVVVARDQASFIIDATPQTGNKAWCDANGFAGRNFCPMGAEGSSNRPFCEALFGPYTVTCPGQTCFANNNPLQYKVTKPTAGGTVTFTALNGVAGQVNVPASN